jgi:hypothetical protein
MPRITKDKLGSGAWSAVDYEGRHFTPDRMSDVRCAVCRMQLVDVLAEAGETTHPACAGWPNGGRRTPGASRAREALASAQSKNQRG